MRSNTTTATENIYQRGNYYKKIDQSATTKKKDFLLIFSHINHSSFTRQDKKRDFFVS